MAKKGPPIQPRFGKSKMTRKQIVRVAITSLAVVAAIKAMAARNAKLERENSKLRRKVTQLNVRRPISNSKIEEIMKGTVMDSIKEGMQQLMGPNGIASRLRLLKAG